MHSAHLPDPDTLADLEVFAVDLAAGAGRLVSVQTPRRLAVGTKSSDTDVVTEMDERSQAYLTRWIRAMRPEDGLLGEEAGGRLEAGTSGLTWVLDPIDGTVNYLYGRPEYAVSVAVVTGDVKTPGAWSPVAAAVCAPIRGEIFHARRGGGAVRLDALGHRQTLSVNDEDQLGLALLGTGFGYQASVRAEQAGIVAAILPKVRDLRRAGCAALDVCAVASGELDAYYERGVHAWDVAGGWLIAEEAGAVVTGIASSAPLADGMLVAGPRLHGSVQEALLQAGGNVGGAGGTAEIRDASPVDG